MPLFGGISDRAPRSASSTGRRSPRVTVVPPDVVLNRSPQRQLVANDRIADLLDLPDNNRRFSINELFPGSVSQTPSLQLDQFVNDNSLSQLTQQIADSLERQVAQQIDFGIGQTVGSGPLAALPGIGAAGRASGLSSGVNAAAEAIRALGGAGAGGGGGDQIVEGAPTDTSSVGATQAYVQAQAAERYGWTGGEWAALKDLINKESSWNVRAANPSSSARGLFQFMSFTAPQYNVDHPVSTGRWASLEEQTRAGLQYIRARYGTPSRALAHWKRAVPINGTKVGNWY